MRPVFIRDRGTRAALDKASTELKVQVRDQIRVTEKALTCDLGQPATLAEAEITLTTSVITYAHHAQIGRVHWSRVSGDIFYDQNAPDPAEVLTRVRDAEDVGEVLAAYEPHDPAYLALKAKLAELRNSRHANGPQIAYGP